MGRMFAEGFLRTGIINEPNLFIFTRSNGPANVFKRENLDITLCHSMKQLVDSCNIIMLCVPPNEAIKLLIELSHFDVKNKIFISIVGSLQISAIEKIIPAKIVRMVPSITSEVDEGMFIVTFNEYCNERDSNKITRMFEYLGEVTVAPESKIEAYTDVTSCSPGILSALFQEYISSAVRIGKLPKKDATNALIQTLYGLVKIYKEEEIDFETVIKRVARKGGTTEIGINTVRENIPSTFDKVFEKTIEKQKNRTKELEKEINLTIAST